MSVNGADDSIAWNNDTTYALGLYRVLMRVLGIWPLDYQRNERIKMIQGAGASILQLWMIVIFVKDLITKGNCSVLTDIVDALSLIFTSTLSIMKLILPHVHQPSLYIIVKSAVDDWSNVIDEKSRKIMLKYAYIGRLVFIIQMFGAYSTIIPLIFGNLPTVMLAYKFDDNATNLPFRNIPIGPNCWISPAMPTNIYLAYYCLVTVNLVILCTAYIGGDVYLFAMALHVCGQFELLYHNMESLDEHGSYSVLQKKVGKLSKRHSHLLNLAYQFEKTFNLMILIQVAASGFIIGISGIVLLLGFKNGNSELIISSLIRIYMLYIQLFIYNYIGEQLTTQAEKLQVAIYNCSWYNMSSSLIVRDLSFIMMRNNYPFHLTAGKICNMNMASFKNLVKTMFSYFSVIRLMFVEN